MLYRLSMSMCVCVCTAYCRPFSKSINIQRTFLYGNDFSIFARKYLVVRHTNCVPKQIKMKQIANCGTTNYYNFQYGSLTFGAREVDVDTIVELI